MPPANLPLIGLEDLGAFQQSAAQNNMMLQLAPALAKPLFNMQTWSPQAQGATSFAQAFLGQALAGMGRADVADQTRAVGAVLPKLYSNPSAVAVPEGVDATAFETIRNSAAVRSVQRQAMTDQLRQDLAFDLFKEQQKLGLQQQGNVSIEILKGMMDPNPRTRAEAQKMASSILGLEVPPAAEPVAPQQEPKPTKLFGDGETLATKMNARFKAYLDDGAPGGAAADMATAELKADRVLNESAAKRVEEARARAASIRELSQKARYGVENAGETGGALGGIRETASRLFATVSSDEQSQRDAQKVLESIAPDVIKATRSPGALTEREMDTLLRSGPSSKSTPSENKSLIDVMEQVGKFEQDYSEFLDAYVAERGDTRGADALWNKYKEKNPLYRPVNGKLVLNQERQPWTDFDFTGKPSDRNGTAKAQGSIVTGPDGKEYEIFD